jgi:hypothetical protein
MSLTATAGAMAARLVFFTAVGSMMLWLVW